MVLDADLAALSVCDLQTLGRVTGRTHVVEMWFAADPERERLYILSGGRDASDWVRNLGRNPTVQVRLGGRWRSGVASEIEGSDDDSRARRLLAAKYQGWSEGGRLSSWARNSLPIAVDLEPS